jgi:hypothetical protein
MTGLVKQACVYFVLAVALGFGSSPLTAGTWIELAPDGAWHPTTDVSAQAPEVVVSWYNDSGLEATFDLLGFEMESLATEAGQFLRLTCPETALAGEVGTPGLPVIRRLVGVPHGARVSLAFREESPAVIALSAAGAAAPLWPMQGPYSITGPASGREADLDGVFHFDAAAYASDALAPAERVTVTKLGEVRHRDLYVLEIRPLAYNPQRGLVVAWPRVHASLRWSGGLDLSGLRTFAGMSQAVLNPQRADEPRTGGKLLLVVAPFFVGSAPVTQFVNFKTAQGFTVSTYTPAQGAIAPTVRAYLRSLYGGPNEPDYILIVADANEYGWIVDGPFIPAYTSFGTRYQCRTDIPYACLHDPNGDWMPDVAIGRFPARTVSDLQAIVDKTLYVEAGDFADPTYTQRAALACGPEEATYGETTQNYVIDAYLAPAGIEANRLYYGTYGARTTDLVSAYNAGCFFASYIGHAGGFQAWTAPAFTFADIESLTNTNKYPFIASLACSTSAFHYITPTQSPGFLEKWLLVANKGSVGGWGHSWSLDPYTFLQWDDMYKYLLRAIYADGLRDVGTAAQAAAGYFVAQYGVSDPVSEDFTQEFFMLGDPSLRLPLPPAENYLVVAPPGYVGTAALNQLIAHKQTQHLNVLTYNVPVGSTTQNIKTYIQNLWGTADKPKYILIVGDTSGSTSTNTTIPHWTGLGSKAASTDLYYACMDAGDDWFPEIAIGRFAISSAAELQTVVDKTILVESGTFSNPDYVKRVALLANSDTYGTAEPTDDWVASTYLTPNDYIPVKIYQAQGGNTTDVTNAVNTGCLFVTYMGHSGSSGWWGPAFDQSNVRALTNTGLYPLVFGWSCNTARFESGECFGETWIREANKGAVAYLSASNYIYWGSADAWLPSGILEKTFFTAIFGENIWRVSPAWQRALHLFKLEYGLPADPNGLPTQNLDVIRNFFEEFVLLGDPALQLPRPAGFALTAAPPTDEVCAPPATAAYYNVNIQPLGGFQEAVSLTVSGAPAGSTLSFTQNNLAPPFSSVLTVGNLGAGMVGEYDLTITGTSASRQASASVHLSISSGNPAVPTLLSPTNGATNVARFPTLTWQAAANAKDYDVELSTSPNFTQLTWNATVTQPTATVGTELDRLTTYYWHVRARNNCTASDFSAPFSFTTQDQGDYFTQLFGAGGGNFDLSSNTLFFIPDGSANGYRMCGAPATALPTDPNGGTTLALGDDNYLQITCAPAVLLYGTAHTTAYVNSNGSITFGSGDGTYNESLAAHFDRPRVSALFDDLNPATGGTVSWKQLADRIAVTWWQVPEYGTSNQNTFQIEMFASGAIHLTWLAVAATDGLVGLSRGNGLPSDFNPDDLSAYGPCETPGACCLGETCQIMVESACLAAFGQFQGPGTVCNPNPCLTPQPACVIISEVVQGDESGNCPRWIEVTNTGSNPFTFPAGGVIVQSGSSSDVTVDVVLTGITIPAGYSYVIVSAASGACTGAYNIIYNRTPDLQTNFTFGLGDERFILTDTADGSNLLDIYGQFGVDGTGQPWEFTRGYSYRMPPWNSGNQGVFRANEWYFGGVGSLSGMDPTQLLLDLTTPNVHVFNSPCTGLRGDMDCNGWVDFDDINPFVLAISDPAAYAAAYPDCHFNHGDCNGDGLVDFDDINPFVVLLSR